MSATAAPTTVRVSVGFDDGPSLAAHLRRHGGLPVVPAEQLLDAVDASGLLGRGGAGFPTGRKMRTVAAGKGATVVVANGCEGEPASGKDTLLLTRSPHLVLDGLQAAASAVGAKSAYLAVHAGSRAVPVLRAALAERRDRIGVELVLVPGRYVASEETALVNLINTGTALPTFTPPRPFERGVRRRPTLISNVESLAQVALIARHGPSWFRTVGDADEPGTLLVTASGPPDIRRSVIEVPTGTTVGTTLAATGVDLAQCQAVLVGGYFGTWFDAAAADELPLTHRGLRAAGGALGAGILVGLPRTACAVAETARVATFLAEQSAGQCGPCLNGLPAIADALTRLAHGGWHRELGPALDRWLTVVPGRGACRHPDGAVRFVSTALQVFAADVAAHRSGRPCPAHRSAPVLPVPTPRSAR